jgi:hypothetical protein
MQHRPSPLTRRRAHARAVGDVAGRWAFALVLLIAAVIGMLDIAHGPALFQLGPTMPAPTLVPPAERTP